MSIPTFSSKITNRNYICFTSKLLHCPCFYGIIQQGAENIPHIFWSVDDIITSYCRFIGCASMMLISCFTTFQSCTDGLRSGDCEGLSCSSDQFEVIWALGHGHAVVIKKWTWLAIKVRMTVGFKSWSSGTKLHHLNSHTRWTVSHVHRVWAKSHSKWLGSSNPFKKNCKCYLRHIYHWPISGFSHP